MGGFCAANGWLAGIIFGRTDFIVISVILIGVSLGLAFTLAMMFFVLRTKRTAEAAESSGMSQTVGYLIAASGPPVFGALFSISGSWYVPPGVIGNGGYRLADGGAGIGERPVYILIQDCTLIGTILINKQNTFSLTSFFIKAFFSKNVFTFYQPIK